jgi:hypothetical protein
LLPHVLSCSVLCCSVQYLPFNRSNAPSEYYSS